MGFNLKGGILVHLPHYKKMGLVCQTNKKAIKLYALSSKKDLKNVKAIWQKMLTIDILGNIPQVFILFKCSNFFAIIIYIIWDIFMVKYHKIELFHLNIRKKWQIFKKIVKFWLLENQKKHTSWTPSSIYSFFGGGGPLWLGHSQKKLIKVGTIQK